MTRLKLFYCQHCGAGDLVAGGTSYYHCSACRVALGMRDLTSPKYLAHQAVAKARKQGLLADPRTLQCEDCRAPAIEYDHRDYALPLAVSPVCRRCNLRRGPAKPTTEAALAARAAYIASQADAQPTEAQQAA